MVAFKSLVAFLAITGVASAFPRIDRFGRGREIGRGRGRGGLGPGFGQQGPGGRGRGRGRGGRPPAVAPVIGGPFGNETVTTSTPTSVDIVDIEVPVETGAPELTPVPLPSVDSTTTVTIDETVTESPTESASVEPIVTMTVVPIPEKAASPTSSSTTTVTIVSTVVVDDKEFDSTTYSTTITTVLVTATRTFFAEPESPTPEIAVKNVEQKIAEVVPVAPASSSAPGCGPAQPVKIVSTQTVKIFVPTTVVSCSILHYQDLVLTSIDCHCHSISRDRG